MDNLAIHHKKINWLLSPKSLGVELTDGQHFFIEESNLLVEIYKNSFQKNPSNVTELSANGNLKYSANDPFFEPVFEFINFSRFYLSEFCDNVLIHGSLVDGGFVKGLSDFDVIIVPKEETLLNVVHLDKLRKLLQSSFIYLKYLDPQQHHSFLIFSKKYLYSDNIQIPPALVENSYSCLTLNKIILFNQKIHNKVDSSRLINNFFDKEEYLLKRSCEAGMFLHHPLKGEYLLENFRNSEDNLYQFKNFLGYVSLLPSLYFSALSKPVLKHKSFEKLKQEGFEHELINLSTKIRGEWESRGSKKYLTNQIPIWIPEFFGREYLSRCHELLKLLRIHGKSVL